MPNDTPRRERLPIKLIMPNQGAQRKVPGGGPPPKPFRTVDETYRGRLANQVAALQEAITPQLSRIGAAPVRVKLIPKAAAKSHRPENLLSAQSCPIIGSGNFGELFVKATPQGLQKLSDTIKRNQSDRIIKELSCIESIEPVTPVARRRGLDAGEVLRKSPRAGRGFMTCVRLFNFGMSGDQEKIVEDFEATCRARNLSVKTEGYSPSSFTYGIECREVADVEELSRVIGVRSIKHMPLIRNVRTQMFNPKPLPALAGRTIPDSDLPVVVVVDSGVAANIPELESWVVGRDSQVAPEYQNTDHGTFVAGLICWGHDLNPTVAGLHDGSVCGVLDLQVIPNNDPAKGDTLGLLEQEFLVSLEGWLKQYANKFKVWNLSLGTNTVCSLDDFSELAVELDNFQEQYQVSFVISAGNYDSPPLLDFPRSKDQLEAGRITTPADSVLGITVGAISHVDYKKNGPKEHHPSPYSRHGAGPNHIIKPDLVHYGGSCATDLSHIAGIRSINGSGTAENVGTSFAAPLVSRTLAQIYHHITPTPSPVLARALLTHHARDPRTNGRVRDGDEKFFGFGLPAPIPYCLECSPHSSTLVFDDVLRPGYYLEWDEFPYPASLRRGGRFFGEVWMTVAFAPARGARWGTEYCETHIDAHFGVYRGVTSRTTNERKEKFVGLVPPEHKNPERLYETYQVEKLRKWAPVRTYHGSMGDKGKRGDRWRLKVQLLTRHGVQNEETFKPQPFSLIVTIADPLHRAPVYDEMAQMLRTRYMAQNLNLRTSIQVQAQG